MTTNKLALLFAAICMLLSPLTAVNAQNSKPQSVKRSVEKIGVNKDITVVRADGQWFYGRIEAVDTSSFTVYEIEQGTKIMFGYDQVDRVYKGYGSGAAVSRDMNGHRIPPRKHRIGLITAAVVVAVPIVIALVALSKD